MSRTKVTIGTIRGWSETRPFLAVTAYDYPMARLLDDAGVEILHVGDTLGMVVLGLPDTVDVTLADMVRHTAAVARAKPKALITADLSFGTYSTPRKAVQAANELIEAGAEAVKLEGGRAMLPQIKAILREGIPVQGHIGMLPQHVREEGGYKKKGKNNLEVAVLKDDASALAEAGVFSMVLEAVVPEVAAEITALVRIPTIGIASGHQTRGQIRVLHDVLGLFPWYVPPYAKPQADLAGQVSLAVARLRSAVDKGQG